MIENDLYQLGYNNFLEKSGLFNSSPIAAQSNFSNGISPSVISSGEASFNASLVSGFLQSSNFVSGSTGWQINSNGDVEFGSGTFRGDISAVTGTFTNTLYVNDGSFDRVLIGKGTGLF